ncbi:hypothetical protein ILYODFUR_002158 [Ilyodon furcidens]|uniref:Uncharacterized protein n=1 Tax=Ilyodon furcidens TaxID=33524 RepID=A0ABV0U697_9TELE
MTWTAGSSHNFLSVKETNGCQKDTILNPVLFIHLLHILTAHSIAEEVAPNIDCIRMPHCCHHTGSSPPFFSGQIAFRMPQIRRKIKEIQIYMSLPKHLDMTCCFNLCIELTLNIYLTSLEHSFSSWL